MVKILFVYFVVVLSSKRVYTAYCRGVGGGVGRVFVFRNLQILSVQLNRFIYKEAIIWQSRSEKY